MSPSHHTVPTGTEATPAAATMAQVALAAASPAARDLVDVSGRANAALMRGDLETYRGLIPHSDDFTLMSPFGGEPTHAVQLTEERMQALGRFFRNGVRYRQEVVQTYSSADMIALALIERKNVEVGGLPAQDWALRVTLVFRRDGGRWLLVHRHADPLVGGITHAEAAALARTG